MNKHINDYNSFLLEARLNLKKDYYKILGVNKNATQDEIKKAYRKLAMQYHPDRNPGNPEAEAKFKELAEAYEIIGDPEERTKYDSAGSMFNLKSEKDRDINMLQKVATYLNGSQDFVMIWRIVSTFAPEIINIRGKKIGKISFIVQSIMSKLIKNRIVSIYIDITKFRYAIYRFYANAFTSGLYGILDSLFTGKATIIDPMAVFPNIDKIELLDDNGNVISNNFNINFKDFFNSISNMQEINFSQKITRIDPLLTNDNYKTIFFSAGIDDKDYSLETKQISENDTSIVHQTIIKFTNDPREDFSIVLFRTIDKTDSQIVEVKMSIAKDKKIIYTYGIVDALKLARELKYNFIISYINSIAFNKKNIDKNPFIKPMDTTLKTGVFSANIPDKLYVRIVRLNDDYAEILIRKPTLLKSIEKSFKILIDDPNLKNKIDKTFLKLLIIK